MLRKSLASDQGHMDQERKNKRSTTTSSKDATLNDSDAADRPGERDPRPPPPAVHRVRPVASIALRRPLRGRRTGKERTVEKWMLRSEERSPCFGGLVFERRRGVVWWVAAWCGAAAA